MARKTAVTFATARAFARSMPNVTAGTAYGKPALKVNGKMFACITSHRSAEPNSLAVRVAMADRDDLLAADPDTYYLTPHYEPYPCIVVRLARIHPDALRDLLQMGCAFVSRKRTKG